MISKIFFKNVDNKNKSKNKKNIYLIDLKNELEEIEQREFIQKDGTYKILVREDCLYIIKNNNKFECMNKPYLIIGQKKLEVLDVF
ncbi:MAG: hypothetical protein QXV44_01220 [Candidatus Anstonellaceae archaeon]